MYAVNAVAYTLAGRDLTQGVVAFIQAAAPTLALDAAQNSVSALQTAVSSALSSARQPGTQVAVGDGASVSGATLPPLWQLLAGGLSSTFKLPENTQSIIWVGKVASGTPMTLIIGLNGNQP